MERVLKISKRYIVLVTFTNLVNLKFYLI